MAANLELELEQAEVGRARERRLPFAFAKRHGVLIQGLKDGHTEAVYRQGVSILSLAEVRRFVDGPVQFSCVDSETFDDQLQTAYESGAAMTMMEGLDDELESILGPLRTKSREGLALIKATTLRGMGMSMEDGVELESRTFAQYMTTSPHPAEGIKAFIEKRTPEF